MLSPFASRTTVNLAHFGSCDPDHAGVVGLDRNPHIDLSAIIGCCRGRADAKWKMESECEPAARCGGGDDEPAA
jgi:hypothetical protein